MSTETPLPTQVGWERREIQLERASIHAWIRSEMRTGHAIREQYLCDNDIRYHAGNRYPANQGIERFDATVDAIESRHFNLATKLESVPMPLVWTITRDNATSDESLFMETSSEQMAHSEAYVNCLKQPFRLVTSSYRVLFEGLCAPFLTMSDLPELWHLANAHNAAGMELLDNGRWSRDWE